jgi:hypothetical protein
MASKKLSVVSVVDSYQTSSQSPGSVKRTRPIAAITPASSVDILDPVDVGKRLKIPARTNHELTRKVYELTRKRASRPLPCFTVGKLIRFRWSDIERWIDEGTRAA